MFKLQSTSSARMQKHVGTPYTIVSLKMGYPAYFKDENGGILRTSTVVKFEFLNNMLTVDTANSRYTFEPAVIPQTNMFEKTHKKLRIFSRAL
jgi:hypothetical protein